MLDKVKNILEDFKAQDVVVMNMPDTAIVDSMVVATGTSSRHLWTLAEKLTKAMKEIGVRGVVEGDSGSNWVVIDLQDILVHLFTEEVRNVYNIESLWLERPEGQQQV